MSIPSSSWRHPPDASGWGRALVRAAHHRLSTLRGLGDLVAWVLMRVGIHALSTCGCDRRRRWLNRIVPFRFTGKSLFHPRSSAAVSAVVVNRLGAAVRGRIQLRADNDEPLLIELPMLAAGASVIVIDGWTTNHRSRDRWSWMLEVAGGRIHTGSVVCGVEGTIEIGLEATPGPRLEFRQAHGTCVVDLA